MHGILHTLVCLLHILQTMYIVSNCIISLKWDKSLKMKIQIFTFLLFGDETVGK